MAEQKTARQAKKAADGAVPTMSTPIFDELLREMAAQRGQAKQVESKHRAT